MAARITLILLALVVGMVFCTAPHAKPLGDEPPLKPSTVEPSPEPPKWSCAENFGRIGQVSPTTHGVYFTLVGGKTGMQPESGYYLVDKTHPTFEAMYDLLYLVAKERWAVEVYTEPTPNDKGHATAIYLWVDFPPAE